MQQVELGKIVILETDANKKGDLFGRLMGDLFHALGYGEIRFNIHQTGREIDLKAYHRTEHRVAIGEFKAHSEKIGGGELNKFAGVLEVEKRKLKKDKSTKHFSVSGYYISLSGFKETAIEQENELGNGRMILIKPEKIVEELIKGRMLVPIERAISTVENLRDLNLILIEKANLLAFEKGWIWAIYFRTEFSLNPSHVALVHADGKPLVKEVAEEIILKDNESESLLKGLKLLHKQPSESESQQKVSEAKQKYFKYLENELGEIQFEGLPTDKEAGAVKVKLENIFVPLHLTSLDENRIGDFDSEENTRQGIGAVLKLNSRIAILAKPGGGKSTLLKRIAIAYAFPERRPKINDELPNIPWFPIFLRCRELGERVVHSITEILNAIPNRAEISQYSHEFSILISDALQNGTAMLLIDGLDEIAEDRSRITFVNQLRTFLATYPTTNIVVTSREAGFRIVGGALANYCAHFKISNLNLDEIKSLCKKWHIAIIDDSQNTIREAQKLSDVIIGDRRIKALAENPLLLTTLLFVRRWAGYLPTKRSVLYQEMIKLLLVTWNVEGHAMLDIEEAEPQLAFMAYWMTKNRLQRIKEEDLTKCLINARQQMPEILGYTNITPSEFIKRVESRSSLLIMSGHEKLESGATTQIYEFLHLSFQEYLTAKAIVKRYLPTEDASEGITTLLGKHINEENWKEVIPLSAVLLEREAKKLIQYLIEKSKEVAQKGRHSGMGLAPALLGSCMANEVQVEPSLLEEAIEWWAKNYHSFPKESSTTPILLKSKFGEAFRRKIANCFFENFEDQYIRPLGDLLSDIFLYDAIDQEKETNVLIKEISTKIFSTSKRDKCYGILGLMAFSFSRRNLQNNHDENLAQKIFSEMLSLTRTGDSYYCFSVAWCLIWSDRAFFLPANLLPQFVDFFVPYWLKSPNSNLKDIVGWMLKELLSPNLVLTIRVDSNLEYSVRNAFQNYQNGSDKVTVACIAFLLRISLEPKIVEELIRSEIDKNIVTNSREKIRAFADSMKIELKSQS